MSNLNLGARITNGRKYALGIFLIAVTIRTLPEILSGPYPVGYDLVAGYAPSLYGLPELSPLKVYGWAWSPLTIFSLWSVWKLSGMDLYLFLKGVGPIFYGLFTLSFYYLLSKGFDWKQKKSFLTTILLLLQPAILRMGWDQFREELGLIFLFVLLMTTKGSIIAGSRVKNLTVLALSILVVLSHQLSAILLFFVALWQIFDIILKKGRAFLKTALLFLPLAVIFAWQLHGQFVNPNFSPNFIPLHLPTGTNIFAFTNYFLHDPRFIDGNYLGVLSYVGSLSLCTVAPIVLLSVKGFFKDKIFTPMLIWLSIAGYSVVVYPYFAFSSYWWWILLLPVPLTVFAGEGLERLGLMGNSRFTKRKRVFWAAFVLLGVVALGYSMSVINFGYSYSYEYIPSGLVESAVPFEDIKDVESAFHWLNGNSPLNSLVVVPEKLQGWAYMILRGDILIRVAPSKLELSKSIILLESVKNSSYAVWYNDELDQFSLRFPKIEEFGGLDILQVST